MKNSKNIWLRLRTTHKRYLYEGDKVVAEADATNQIKARNIYGTNLLSRQVDNELLFYMYNAHGDVTALINTTGAVVATYDYDAFGTITEKTGTVNNSITYAGYQYDAESDMYYLNARYYDSKIARFMTEDTYRGQANDPLSLNLYSYVSNNPVRYYDPTGHTLMTVGSSGTEVAKMQGMLIQAGYNLGSSGADGKFGNKTLAAIKDFQNKTGCTVDGKVGNQTMTVLAAAVKAPLSAGVDLEKVAANAKTGGLTTSVVAPNKNQTNQTQEVKKINTTPTPPKVPILPKPAAVVKPTLAVVKGTSATMVNEIKQDYYTNYEVQANKPFGDNSLYGFNVPEAYARYYNNCIDNNIKPLESEAYINMMAPQWKNYQESLTPSDYIEKALFSAIIIVGAVELGAVAVDLGIVGIGNAANKGAVNPVDSKYIPTDKYGKPIPLAKQTVNGQDIPLPDPNARGPHTTLGGAISSKTGETYLQSATFPKGSWPTANGQNVPWSEVHWFDHGRSDHTNPHQHIFDYDWYNNFWRRGNPSTK